MVWGTQMKTQKTGRKQFTNLAKKLKYLYVVKLA